MLSEAVKERMTLLQLLLIGLACSVIGAVLVLFMMGKCFTFKRGKLDALFNRPAGYLKRGRNRRRRTATK